MKDPKERRRHPRFQAVLQVNYGEDAFALDAASTETASMGGLFIITEHPLSQGTRILIHLFLPDASLPIIADCEVSWVKVDKEDDQPSGMGVRFLEIGEEDSERLNLFFMLGL